MSPRWAAKIDSTAKARIAEAKELGCDYHSLNAAIDGLIMHRGRVFMVDFKSSKKVHKMGHNGLTKTQRELVQRRWPIWFIETRDDLIQMLNHGNPL